MITITVDGREIRAEPGISVAAALLNAGIASFRTSVSGEPRAPLCGMGVCFECRATIDNIPHERACMISVAAGMDVRTGV